MRVSMAGVVLVAVTVALLTAVVVGMQRQQELPERIDTQLVELGPDAAGQPAAEVDTTDGLRAHGVETPTTLLLGEITCVGGAFGDAGTGVAVIVEGLRPGVDDGTPQAMQADSITLDCS